MKTIYVINGPNLNLLGVREPDKYGKNTYADLIKMLENHAKENNYKLVTFQSNHEGDLVDEIQDAFYHHADGIVINPGAYTHTSIALLDAVLATSLKTVEVHITDVSRREEFRQVSYIRKAVKKTIMGKGLDGYIEGIEFLLDERKGNEN